MRRLLVMVLLLGVVAPAGPAEAHTGGTLTGFENPESAPWDSATGSFYVSNMGPGPIDPMGRAPDGTVKPNGTGDVTTGRTDFWWDQYLGNTGNCWHDNIGKDGTAASVTSTPLAPLLPSACDSTSVGTVGPQQEPELLNCLADITFDTKTCPRFTTPSKP